MRPGYPDSGRSLWDEGVPDLRSFSETFDSCYSPDCQKLQSSHASISQSEPSSQDMPQTRQSSQHQTRHTVTMGFGIATRLLGKCILKYYRLSYCRPVCKHHGLVLGRMKAFQGYPTDQLQAEEKLC